MGFRGRCDAIAATAIAAGYCQGVRGDERPRERDHALTFTLTNPDAAFALTGVGFTDALPAGLVVATPNGLTSTCGGTVTAIAGSGSVALANGGLLAGDSCTIGLNVTGVTAGVKNNTTSAVSLTEGGAGGPRPGQSR